MESNKLISLKNYKQTLDEMKFKDIDEIKQQIKDKYPNDRKNQLKLLVKLKQLTNQHMSISTGLLLEFQGKHGLPLTQTESVTLNLEMSHKLIKQTKSKFGVDSV